MKHETIKIIQLLSLVVACICFLFGFIFSIIETNERILNEKLDSSLFDVKVLNKENIEAGYYYTVFEYTFKVTNNSEYSIDELEGYMQIYNGSKLVTTSTVTLSANPALAKGKSSTWTVTSRIQTGDTTIDLWNLSYKEMEIRFKISEIIFTDEGYRSYADTADFKIIKSSTSNSNAPGNGHTHSYSEKITDAQHLATAANCEDAATYYYSCSCGAIGTNTFIYGSPSGHNFNVTSTKSKYLATAASCGEAAKYFYSCSCGEKGTNTFTYGSPSGHNFNVTSTESKYLATAANCKDAATYYYSCSCGEIGTETFAYGEPNNTHNVDASGYCTICDEPLASTEGVIYDFSLDGTYAEVIGYSGEYENVIIASEFNGVPVKNIYQNSFRDLPIVSIIIPNTVTGIENYAFCNCTSLTSVTIPNSVTSIGGYAFAYCDNLTSVTFGDNSQLTTIGDCAFYSCDNLASITIPNSVTSIGGYAFAYCDNLTSVTFEDNSQLTTIGNNAFYDCDNLTSVTFGDNSQLATIGNEAFDCCVNLTSVIIPNSVTSIGNLAFYGCYNLIYIKYRGSEAEWDAITKDTNWDSGWYGYITYNYTGD